MSESHQETLTARQAYLAMYEFLGIEADLAAPRLEIHLGGLLSEMAPEPGGDTCDPGAWEQFREALAVVRRPDYQLPQGWSEDR